MRILNPVFRSTAPQTPCCSRLESPGLRIDVNLMGFVLGIKAGRCLLFEYGIALPGDETFQKPALDRIDLR
jgi:hypothetical protein